MLNLFYRLYNSYLISIKLSIQKRKKGAAKLYQVMIVDDEPNTLDKLADFVEKSNLEFHVISKALGPEDALRDLNTVKPDLVLTDIRMPIIDGLSLLQQMRESGWDGFAAIITGYDDFDYAQQAIRLDVFEYLLKPVIFEDIVGLLSRAKQLFEKDQKKMTKLRSEFQGEQQDNLNKEKENRLPSYILQAKTYIKEYYTEALTLKQIAQIVSVTPAYLSSRFVKYCGQNFWEYVTQVRIVKAKELLKSTNLQVQEIAQKVGYTDVAYFSRIFRRITGITPLNYRKYISELPIE